MATQMMKRCLLLIVAVTLLLAASAQACSSVVSSIKNGQAKMHGVNLGGWLVAECWLTPASPPCKASSEQAKANGEYAMAVELGVAQTNTLFQQHRSTFITEQDFAGIAQAGANAVRIPVGYWIFGGDNNGGGDSLAYRKFASENGNYGIGYLDKAFSWACNYNLGVLVNVHAAKGSQNGQSHSAPSNAPQVYWSGYPENIANTLDLVTNLTRRYKDNPAFIGIGLLNEPSAAVDVGTLQSYYKEAYARVRALSSDCVLVTSPILDNQLDMSATWMDFMTWSQGYSHVWHDWHLYQVWGYEGKTPDYIINAVSGTDLSGPGAKVASWTGNYLFIGEWSMAGPCEKSTPAHDACVTANSPSLFSNAKRSEYGKVQLSQWEKAGGGHAFWSWKSWFEGVNPFFLQTWTFKDSLANGWLGPPYNGPGTPAPSATTPPTAPPASTTPPPTAATPAPSGSSTSPAPATTTPAPTPTSNGCPSGQCKCGSTCYNPAQRRCVAGKLKNQNEPNNKCPP